MLRRIKNRMIRFRCYLQDGPLWQKRWLPTTAGFRTGLTELPMDEAMLSKRDNPRWREERSYALFRVPAGTNPSWIESVTDDGHSVTFWRVRTQYFAMRVDNVPVQVRMYDFWDNSIQPELVLDEKGKPIIFPLENMEIYGALKGLQISYR